MLRRIIVLGEKEDILDKITKTANESKHTNGWLNIRNGFGLNGHRIDLTNFSLKKFTKKVSGQVEKDAIVFVLKNTGWNRSKASKILKVSYKTLITKIKELEIEPPEILI